MNFRLISLAIYSTYLTNKFGILLKKAKTTNQKMQLRNEYAKTLFKKLNITLEIKNKEKIPQDGKYLLISNHKSIIDPLIVELALEQLSKTRNEVFNFNSGCTVFSQIRIIAYKR